MQEDEFSSPTLTPFWTVDTATKDSMPPYPEVDVVMADGLSQCTLAWADTVVIANT